jgi:nitrogen fixation protein NifB
VASSNGREVDLHLGEAAWLLIVGPWPDGTYGVLSKREAPEPGGNRWQRLAKDLADCFALLVADAGDNPRRILAENGIPVLTGEGGLAGLAETIFTAGSGEVS